MLIRKRNNGLCVNDGIAALCRKSCSSQRLLRLGEAISLAFGCLLADMELEEACENVLSKSTVNAVALGDHAV